MIDFDVGRWHQIKENATRWWLGELKRPVIQLRLSGHDPGRPEPVLARKHRTAQYDFSISAEEIVDRWDFDLSRSKYLGDAFPAIILDFGPGVIAAFAGGQAEVGLDTVWFHPRADLPVKHLRFKMDAKNEWFLRVQEIMRCAQDRWQGDVQVGMTDLGGNLDILSSFRPGEKLLLDLYDDPEGVKASTWAAHDIWWQAYDALNAILQPANPGYTAWTPIFSEDSYYILQCDFCYMIGPDMFDTFVKPELTASCKRLVNPFYHLDGRGQLPHLDSLLTIEELKGVQWIPGAGRPGFEHWPEVYRKIRDAGKLIQFSGTIATFETLVEKLGSAEGFVYLCSEPISREAEAIDFLKKYGVLT
jgi:5-methyltetrahydrofolate--homocysteine methyltransferase